MSDTPEADSRSENERYYDDEMAPKLLALMEECRARGMSILATVEYDSGNLGSTIMLQPVCCFAMALVQLATVCEGNVDSLMLAVARHARLHGHNSFVLARLGVPGSPGVPDPETTH